LIQGKPVEIQASLKPQQHGASRLARWLLASALLLSPWVQAREALSDNFPTVQLAELPRQAQETHARVLTGGPFRYEKDGSVFGNRERLLPQQSRGYYREYTVRTPGARNRGARRLVCGGQPPTAPAACYYTEDHYASFRRVQR
jgi:ribonuclease T1